MTLFAKHFCRTNECATVTCPFHAILHRRTDVAGLDGRRTCSACRNLPSTGTVLARSRSIRCRLVVVRLMACRLSQICSSAHLVVTAFGFAKRWRDP